MCTNGRYIFNPYSRRKVFVSCGHCDACRQQKAMRRAQRIRNNLTDGTIALFITLTYTNDYVPYVLKEDIEKVDHGVFIQLPIYRRCTTRFVFDRHSGQYRLVKSNKITLVDCCPSDSLNDISRFHYNHLVGLPGNYIGVPYYPDLQNFFKRLRQILIRHYNYEKSFSYFGCSELGSHTKRPHFHALVFIPSAYEELFRSAILEAWPYADKDRTAKFIEVARDCANYVSSYVSSDTHLLPLFQNNMFKPKHSASKGFGVVLDCFTLPKILEKIDNRDMVYHRRFQFDGSSSVIKLPVPKYVLHRYFPLCKGFGWLSSCQLRSILLSPERVGDLLTDFSYQGRYEKWSFQVDRVCKLSQPLYHYTPQETYEIYVRLENCYQRFHDETGLSRFDFAFYYERVWSLYYCTLERMMHENILCFEDYADFYENGLEVSENDNLSPTLSNLNIQIDPNKRKDVVIKTALFKSLFYRMDKQRKVTNYCMSKMQKYYV